ncbi:MAG: recombination protein NinB [Gammaproteobacteria bacterium]
MRNRNQFVNIAAQIGDILDEGKPYTVTIKKFQRIRSLDQNKKFHAMLRDLADHVGYTESEMKDWAKAELGLIKELHIGANIVGVPLPSSEYTVEQLSELIERIYQTGSEAGCVFQDDVDENGR